MIHFYNYIKRILKLKKFKKCCIVGANFTCSHKADVFIEDGGLCQIGDNCDINSVISVKQGGKVLIGNYTTIRGGVVGAVQSICIGDYVIISNSVHIYDNNNHPTSPKQRIELCKSGFYSDLWHWKHSSYAPVCIEDNVWIGERATILKGVTIGKGAIIASNTVVTKDVPQYAVFAGNPGKVVKYLR